MPGGTPGFGDGCFPRRPYRDVEIPPLRHMRGSAYEAGSGSRMLEFTRAGSSDGEAIRSRARRGVAGRGGTLGQLAAAPLPCWSTKDCPLRFGCLSSPPWSGGWGPVCAHRHPASAAGHPSFRRRHSGCRGSLPGSSFQCEFPSAEAGTELVSLLIRCAVSLRLVRQVVRGWHIGGLRWPAAATRPAVT